MIPRTTIQKELVLDAVKQLHNHATADEVYELVQSAHPNISKGTVYRNRAVFARREKSENWKLPTDLTVSTMTAQTIITYTAVNAAGLLMWIWKL